MTDWNAGQYLKFERERTRPSRDLADRVRAAAPSSALDIGCGPGNSTAVLRETFPGAAILGVDNSQAMLDKARSRYPELCFAFCDGSRAQDSIHEKFDLVFSNACLQWLPDHPAVIRDWFGLLNPGGTLAVQMPMNGHAPLFRIIAAIAVEPRWQLDAVCCEPNDVLEPEAYHDILKNLTADFELWETTYFHRMASHRALVEWVQGTRLRPYLNALDEAAARQFEAEILERATAAYPRQSDGTILFRFRRFFFTARRAHGIASVG